jgi:uncharacterized protein
MRRARIILAVTALVCFFASLSAEPVAQLHPSNYVNDFAHVLSAETQTQLNDICKQIDEKAHAQIAVVTVNSLDGRDVEGYAVDLFKQWGVGSKATDHGVLILVAVQDHRDRIEVGYGLEPILPDGKVGGFMREAVPSFKQNDYDGGVKLMTLRVANVIATDAGIQLTGAEAPAAPVEQPQSGLSATGIVLIIIAIIIVLVTPPLRKVLFWWLIFGGGSRGGGWGGGGFGGGGGGGFGGFGGGSSGGGGASGSW